jgi:hypothetical protein
MNILKLIPFILLCQRMFQTDERFIIDTKSIIYVKVEDLKN